MKYKYVLLSALCCGFLISSVGCSYEKVGKYNISEEIVIDVLSNTKQYFLESKYLDRVISRKKIALLPTSSNRYVVPYKIEFVDISKNNEVFTLRLDYYYYFGSSTIIEKERMVFLVMKNGRIEIIPSSGYSTDKMF